VALKMYARALDKREREALDALAMHRGKLRRPDSCTYPLLFGALRWTPSRPTVMLVTRRGHARVGGTTSTAHTGSRLCRTLKRR